MTSPKTQPITASACDEEWLEMRREIILRDGYALRGGEGNSIELCSQHEIEHLAAYDPLRLNRWVPLQLPNGARSFSTAADRDAVLSRLISIAALFPPARQTSP